MSCSKINTDEEFPDWAKSAATYYPEWNRKLYQYKTFRRSQESLLKGYIGLISFGPPSYKSTSVPDLSELFYEYSAMQKKIIETIFGKFEFNGKHRITVNHTYLYLKNGTVQNVFRQKSDSEVHFIDILGRVYQSWKDFCDTNRSISCPFLAPVDGLHKPDQQLNIYLPPKVWKVFKILDATLFVGCTVLALALAFTGVGLAATIAIVCGGASASVYNVGKSIYTLVDRHKHKMSIGFDNAESVACWLNIGTSVITFTSSLALPNAARIVHTAGRFGDIAKLGLKGLSVASLVSNLGTFGAHFYYLHQKRLNGEKITRSDALGVCINVFLTLGAVYNTKEMFNFINNLEVRHVAAGIVTDLEKGYVQKISTEIDGNNYNTTSFNDNMAEIVVSQENLPYMDFNFVISFAENSLLKSLNERTQQMYLQCFAIGKACADFNENKRNISNFICTLHGHLKNLYHLIKEENTAEKKLVEPHLKARSVENALSELIEPISQVFKNATTDVKKNDEYLQHLRSEINSIDDIIHRSTRSKYEIILETVKNRIPHTTQHDEILSCFDEQLSLIIDEIDRKLNENYRQYVSNSEALFCGQIAARTLFEKIGLKTKKDFANENFHSVMKSFNNGVHSFDHSREIERIMKKLFSLYKELFLMDNSVDRNLSELDILNTCKVLQRSSTLVLQRLNRTFVTCYKFYDTHLQFFGHDKTMNMMLEALQVPRNGLNLAADSRLSLFFNVASKKLDFDEITPQLWMSVSDEEDNFAQPVTNDCAISDAEIQSTLLSLNDKFFRKIETKLPMNDDERAERLKHVYDYFTKNFIAMFQKIENENRSNFPEFLKLSELFFDPQRTMLNRLIKVVCETNKSQTFASVEKYFNDKENFEALVENYISKWHNIEDFIVEMYKNNGVQLFLTNKSAGILTEQDYILKATRLFELNGDEIEFIKMENDTAVLKCLEFYVTFQATDNHSMIVAKIDNYELSREITSEVSDSEEFFTPEVSDSEEFFMSEGSFRF